MEKTHSLNIEIAQINPKVGAVQRNADKVRQVRDQCASDTDLIVFPEMVLAGHPLEDLVLKPSFLEKCEKILEQLVAESKGNRAAMVVTSPCREHDKIYNSLHVIHDGHIIATQHKHQLPNYGVFDEARVFSKGPLPHPVFYLGHKIGFMICEDMWSPEVTDHLTDKGAEMLIVCNGSPYDCRKTESRFTLARQRVEKSGVPLFYVNLFGGQDELVFDGGSFILNEGGEKIYQAPYFVEHFGRTAWEKTKGGNWLCDAQDLLPYPEEPEALYTACVLGVRDYLHKNGHMDVLIGLSGGIDSALSTAIAVDALGSDHVHCVMMPSPFTSQESLDAAREISDLLDVNYREIPITPLMKTFEETLPQIDGLAHENMQSRMRGNILMSLSNKEGHLVLSTGNKSEYAVGYATLYGDMCGAFSVLKDMFKTQVYEISKWRNHNIPRGGLGPKGTVIPDLILNRAPSAELRADQKDQDSLPPYEVLDDILRYIVEKDMSLKDIVDKGFDENLVMDIWYKVDSQEYKRRQGPPGVKLTTRAFGRERRYPMTNGFRPSG